MYINIVWNGADSFSLRYARIRSKHVLWNSFLNLFILSYRSPVPGSTLLACLRCLTHARTFSRKSKLGLLLLLIFSPNGVHVNTCRPPFMVFGHESAPSEQYILNISSVQHRRRYIITYTRPQHAKIFNCRL